MLHTSFPVRYGALVGCGYIPWLLNMPESPPYKIHEQFILSQWQSRTESALRKKNKQRNILELALSLIFIGPELV